MRRKTGTEPARSGTHPATNRQVPAQRGAAFARSGRIDEKRQRPSTSGDEKRRPRALPPRMAAVGSRKAARLVSREPGRRRGARRALPAAPRSPHLLFASAPELFAPPNNCVR
ncbi:hypothetical protein DP42_5340 [Burkholderia pseudomallei]|nr:hypothetical protein DP42_5340 [Burkholderia pseudomallei]